MQSVHLHATCLVIHFSHAAGFQTLSTLAPRVFVHSRVGKGYRVEPMEFLKKLGKVVQVIGRRIEGVNPVDYSVQDGRGAWAELVSLRKGTHGRLKSTDSLANSLKVVHPFVVCDRCVCHGSSKKVKSVAA